MYQENSYGSNYYNNANNPVDDNRDNRYPRQRDRDEKSEYYYRGRDGDKKRDRRDTFRGESIRTERDRYDRDRIDRGDRDRERGDRDRADREKRERDNREKESRYEREKNRDHREDDKPELYTRNGEELRVRCFRSVYGINFNNRPTLFNIAPPGYEQTPVLEFKHLKATGALPVMAIPQGSTIIPRARRLLVENFPNNIDPIDFVDKINQEFHLRNLNIKPGDPALILDIHKDHKSAYIEFRTSEEANAALQLDGFIYNNVPIKISRPQDYQPHDGYYFGCPHVFQDTLNKLFVACIPIHLSDDEVRELLTAFGELKAFNLVKDGASGLSKGYAFCEYRDGTVTDIAIAGLNNMQIADKKLVVQRAVLGSRAGTNLGGIIPSQMQVPDVDPDHIISHELLVTEVLCFINMMTQEDSKNERLLKEIYEDVWEECGKYGKVLDVLIPPQSDKVPFLGKIFVRFADKDSCKEAHESLAGRKFMDRLVLTTFYDPDKFDRKEF